MSLLDDNDYSSDDDPFSVKESSGRSSGKGKKSDKKGRGGDDKKAAHWSRHKDDVVQEKALKKGKNQPKTASTSRSPPESPKQAAPQLVEGGKGVSVRPPPPSGGTSGTGGGQLQPSQNSKNQRKRYSQLGSDSEEEDEVIMEDVLLSNKPVIQDHMKEGGAKDLPMGNNIPFQQLSTNPFLPDVSAAQFFSGGANLPPATATTDVTTSLGTEINWPSMGQQQQQQQQQQQAWLPMAPQVTMKSGMGTINPLLFTSAFDTGPNLQQQQQQQQQQLPSLAFDPNPMTFEHAQSQPVVAPPPVAATVSQKGPWGVEEDPIMTNKDSSQLVQLQQSGPSHPLDHFTGEVDTNPFNQSSWPVTHPPESKPSKGFATTELPVQYPEMAPPPAAVAPPPSEEDWSVSEELCSKCILQFSDLQPVNGVLEGDKARTFFTQSKLPFQELSAIWRLSDRDQDNALSRDEFCIAMKLVLMRRKGLAIPMSLPEPLSLLTLGPCSGDSDVKSGRPASSAAPVTSTTSAGLLIDSSSPVPGDSRGVSPILVDLQEPRPSDADSLLVNLDDSLTLDRGPVDQVVSLPSQPPAVARIISLDDSDSTHQNLSLQDDDDEEDEDSVLVKLDKQDDQGSKGSRQAKPAASKPRVPKFKRPPPPAISKKKTPPTAGMSKASSSGELISMSPTQTSPPSSTSSPPHPLTSSSTPDTVPHIIDSSNRTHPAPPKPPRPYNMSSKKSSSYKALLSSPLDSSNPDPNDSPPASAGDSSRDHAPVLESESEGTFQWKPLSDVGLPSSSADENSEKGHSRSTSLDLNKMLLESVKSGDVFGGLPSAVPPKVPPKLKRVSSPPPDSLMKVLEGVEGGGPATFTVGQSRPRSLSTGSLASTGGAAASSEDHCSSMDTSADALLLHSSLEASTDPLVYKPSVPLKPKPRKVPLLPPKPSSFHSTSSNSTTTVSNPAATTSSSGNGVSSSLPAASTRHPGAKASRNVDVGGASALRRTGPQNRANLAELYQQSDYTAEEYPRTEPKAASDAGASGGKDLEGSRPKAVSSGGSAGVKDKTELKASIRSLKENNEALQDINRTLEQKLFQLMDERVRLARELDLLNVLS